MVAKRKTQGWARWLLKKIGLSGSGSGRRVKFHEQAAVFEFERQLQGGGGVPDGDTVALGLGPRCAPLRRAASSTVVFAHYSSRLSHLLFPCASLDARSLSFSLSRRCVNNYLSPLSENEDKDEYASSGYLPVAQRTKLLSEWHPKPTAMKAAIEKARPEIEKLQRSRDETALSPRDQRYMPSNMVEAQMLASGDAEEAEAARLSAAARMSEGSSSPPSRAGD